MLKSKRRSGNGNVRYGRNIVASTLIEGDALRVNFRELFYEISFDPRGTLLALI